MDARDFLRAVYADMKAKKERFSYLDFSEFLGFSRTNVAHLIVTGRRVLSEKSGKKIASALHLSGQERSYFEKLIRLQHCKDLSEREAILRDLVTLRNQQRSTILTRGHLEYLSAWYHPVIREMTLLKDFNGTVGWLVDRLQMRIKPQEVHRSLHLLGQLGFVRYDSDHGTYAPIGGDLSTGDEVDGLAVVRFHQEALALSREALAQQIQIGEEAAASQDFSALIFSVSADMAQKIKGEIQQFRKHLLALVSQESQTEHVVQLNMQFFAVSKKKKGSHGV